MSRDPLRAPQRNGSAAVYPDVWSALMLTLLATFAAALVAVLFIELGTLAALGLGQAIGMGAIATMAARRVSQPQADRLGLRGFELRSLIAVLCLVPLVLLASELDNIAAQLAGNAGAEAAGVSTTAVAGDEPAPRDEPAASGAEAREAAGAAHGAEAVLGPLIDPEDPWSLMQAMIVLVGIAPVVEEFFFRGVLQQGLVARMGLVRGITMGALLWTLVRPAPLDHWLRFLAAYLASIALGSALGLARVATGSILASILLSSLWAAVGLGSLALQGRIDLPGLNVEQSHLPWPLTLASLLAAGWATLTLYRVARLRFRIECRAFGLEDPGPS